MTTSPAYELQVAIVTKLKASPAVRNLVGARIYDNVPADAVFPYVSLGPADELPDDIGCRKSFEITLQIDCWSQKVGFPEVKHVSEAVRVALDDEGISLTENALVLFQYRGTRWLRDPDGKTSHAAMTFEAIVEQP